MHMLIIVENNLAIFMILLSCYEWNSYFQVKLSMHLFLTRINISFNHSKMWHLLHFEMAVLIYSWWFEFFFFLVTNWINTIVYGYLFSVGMKKVFRSITMSSSFFSNIYIEKNEWTFEILINGIKTKSSLKKLQVQLC